MTAKESLNKLIVYCEKEKYKGYDPYDGLNSKLFQSLPVIPEKNFPGWHGFSFSKNFP